MFKIRDRVMLHGAPATVVGRIDRLFLEVDYDEPQPAVNYAGQPYTRTSVCAHVALLEPLGAPALF